MTGLSADDAALIEGSIPALRVHGIAFAGRFLERLAACPDIAAAAAGLEEPRERLAFLMIDFARRIERPEKFAEACAAVLRTNVPPEVRAVLRPEHAPALAHAFKEAAQDVFAMGDRDPVLAAWRAAFAAIASSLGCALPRPPAIDQR